MNGVEEKVIKLFVAVDSRDWSTVKECFADQVLLDYSSMNGQPASLLKAGDIISAWQGVLPGFQFTHHQLGNIITNVKGSEATVFCYGTATHYLENEGGNLWSVVGSYDFNLKESGNQWKIMSMKFNYKYQDGNTSLPKFAAERSAK